MCTLVARSAGSSLGLRGAVRTPWTSALGSCPALMQVWAYERESMLNWLDAVWSVFLQEVEALKKAVAVKVRSAHG